MSQVSYLGLVGVGVKAQSDIRSQLSPYYNYLATAIKATELRKPVLAWREASEEETKNFFRRQEERKKKQSPSHKRRDRSPECKPLPVGHWIVLEATQWRQEESDKTYEAFYEAKIVHYDNRCRNESSITINDYDKEGMALLAARLPTPVEPDDNKLEIAASPEYMYGNLLWLKPNTYQLDHQQKALRALENAPTNRHAPLIRLCASQCQWPKVRPDDKQEWIFLDDPNRSGTDEQREFVQIALATPDYAILEGPPGSGKTTAICELIGQLARQGKRVLLVASTHVAVDNVLERMLAWQDQSDEKLVMPVRIASKAENVTSEAVEPWMFDRLKSTWSGELLDFLEKPNIYSNATAARKMLADALKKEDSTLVRLILDASNLVCGTTIGILQHPLIKGQRNGTTLEPFDVMILDEASKTTFAEFLVPAIHARKWVVVGDRRQLSPYVEEVDLADNLRNLLPLDIARAVIHTALPVLLQHNPDARSVLSVTSEEESELVRKEAEARGVFICDLDRCEAREWRGIPDTIPELLYAQVIIGRPETLRRFEKRLPVDAIGIGGPIPDLPDWEAAKDSYCSRAKQEIPAGPLDWADEMAWRLVRSYELRQNSGEKEKYRRQIECLIPKTLSFDDIKKKVDNIRRVAMPSILELLQQGFERLPQWREDVVLTGGLPKGVLEARMVSLSYQHRMHPEISAFPRKQFYTKKPHLTKQDHSLIQMYGREYRADQDYQLTPSILGELDSARRKLCEDGLLLDAQYMRERREWGYSSRSRARWIAISPDKKKVRGNISTSEANKIEQELKRFVEWAEKNRHPDNKPWEVALLTFYLQQEKELCKRLQRMNNRPGNTRNFYFPAGSNKENAAVHVILCTVDRFQGHEADVVYLSFVKNGSVGFLNSPNRLNVALTRARYEIVLFGNREYFKKCPSDLLNALANAPEYADEIGWEGRS